MSQTTTTTAPGDPRKTITLVLMLPTDRPRDDGFCLLRKLLKALLRSYGLRLIDIKDDEQGDRTC